MAQGAQRGPGSVAEDAAVVGNRLGPQTTGGAGAAPDLGDVADNIKDAAGDLKSAAVEQGKQLLESAREQATSFADQRKNDAAQSVSDLASSLRETGKSFDERPNIAAFVGSAADGLEQLASGLRDRSFADIYADVEDYARRSPVTVGLAAAAAGFLLARFIKSSADELAEAGAANRAARAAAARRHASAPLDA